MLCAYTVKYHDYAATPIGEVANPDIHETVRENVSWESASTLIVSEAAKFVHELVDAGQSAFINRIESTFIVVKYYEGKIDRYRRFYFENYDDDDADDMENYED
nr:MAG TPA: hypothetical protein [Caudoviricetes sp.]